MKTQWKTGINNFGKTSSHLNQKPQKKRTSLTSAAKDHESGSRFTRKDWLWNAVYLITEVLVRWEAHTLPLRMDTYIHTDRHINTPTGLTTHHSGSHSGYTKSLHQPFVWSWNTSKSITLRSSKMYRNCWTFLCMLAWAKFHVYDIKRKKREIHKQSI